MTETIQSILSILVTVVIVPLITYGSSVAISWLKSKINIEATADLLASATTIVVDSVKAVYQTYVAELKENDKFDEEAQAEAFKKAKELILEQLPETVKVFLTVYTGCIDTWIQVQIEACVDTLKNS